MIDLSDIHRIQLAEELSELVQRPRKQDYPIHTISDKTTERRQLVQMQLVIAGTETRERFPLAEKFPVHFLKQYYPASLHPDPGEEFESLSAISQLLGTPPPIGYTRNSIRSCFIPGKPFDRLSPFGVEPEEQNITIAGETRDARLIGLWVLLEDLFRQVQKLHRAGWIHGDLELHNTVVCLSPIRIFLIDFEASRRKESMDKDEWLQAVEADLVNIYREAVYVQTGIGQQEGELGRASVKAISRIFRDPEAFTEMISAVGLYKT